MRTAQTTRRISHYRAGLAPLELVLDLPIMLFVMALIIIFGTAGAWKIRTLANARQAAWRDFWPRSGANDPHPRGWPASATIRATDGSPPVLPDDPFAAFPVVRGPMLVDPGTGASLPVKDQTLDMTEGLRHGEAHIRRDFPLLAKLPPREINFTHEHVVLDGSRWQFHRMGIASNLTRRILFLYPLDLQGQIPGLVMRFAQAALGVVQNPRKPDLTPLEGGDPEVYQLLGTRSPDFQPRIGVGSERATIDALRGRTLRPTSCEGDPEVVRDNLIDGPGRLKDRIEHVPHRMTGYYISVYQSVINRLQQMNPQPPGAQSQIQELQQKIDQLRQFQGTLGP